MTRAKRQGPDLSKALRCLRNMRRETKYESRMAWHDRYMAELHRVCGWSEYQSPRRKLL